MYDALDALYSLELDAVRLGMSWNRPVCGRGEGAFL